MYYLLLKESVILFSRKYFYNYYPRLKYMKFGFRLPSLNKRIAARTSVKRIIRHNMGLKAQRGWGWITNPKRAAYNRVYNRTSRGCMVTLIWLMGIPLLLLAIAVFFCACSGSNDGANTVYVKPSID